MTKTRRALALLVALALASGLCIPVSAATVATVESAMTGSAAYILGAVPTPQVGSIGGEWAVIGLARGGYDVPQSYWDNYYATVENYVRAHGGVLHQRKYTEYSRVVLALTAIGADPTDVAGYDLLTPLGDFDQTIWQGINGPIWALIALDSGGYDVPVNPAATVQATRQMYIDEILSRQLDDGGWSLTSKGGPGQSDPDITGMALQALSKYQDQAAVKAAINKALDRLSEIQDTDGGYASWGSANSESLVQVIVGLTELGISLDDPRFVKSGKTLVNALLTLRQGDGGFLHTAEGSGSNQMASEQGLYALAAVWRAQNGMSSLYRMDDVDLHVSGLAGKGMTGLPGKHADVQRRTVTAPGTTFDDIFAHENQAAIEAMAARGIITGKSASVFDPDAHMTRAEFAAIVVRALGLTPQANGRFTDVDAAAWYAPFVGTANTYGIVNGTSASTFDPSGTITRQEATVMVARAARLCGMETEMTDYELRNALAPFGDYVSVADWAQSSVAFCYSRDILDQNDLDIQPHQAILRCQVAQMLYNLLDSAKLL